MRGEQIMKRLYGLLAIVVAIFLMAPSANGGYGSPVMEGKNASSWDRHNPTGFQNQSDSTIVWSDSTPDRTLTIDGTGASGENIDIDFLADQLRRFAPQHLHS